jgi:hypothetical protein
VMQVEEVAVLASLEQGAQLGDEEFLGLEGHDLGARRVPVAGDLEEGYRR